MVQQFLRAGGLLSLALLASASASLHRPISAAPPDPPALRYNPLPGTNYVYRLRIEGRQEDQVSVTAGEVWFGLVRKRAPTRPSPEEEPEPRSGSAFVVGPAGYLITCFHVVQHARQIEVTLGTRTYRAALIATDPERDLALLKIDASDLPALRLTDSSEVELGQEARAIGFPLLSILGDSVKVTRGSIAGFLKDREFGHTVFQIDASLNPGNSGGPLVNEMGEAIGVNFAKLDGNVASNVGFATPINFVKDLLRRQQVDWERGTATGRLAGPELVRHVAPSVALVRVQGMPPSPEQVLHLRSRAFLREWTQDEGAAAPADQDLRASVRGQLPVRLEIDDRGNVWDAEPSRALPFLLGTLFDVTFFPFPDTRQPRWELEFQTGVNLSTTTTSTTEADIPDSPLAVPRYFGFRGFPGREDPFSRRSPEEVRTETTTVLIPAVERHQFTLGQQSESAAEIHQEITFKTLADEGVRFDMTAKSRILFDKRAGMPKSMKLTGEMVRRQDGQQEHSPFRLEYSLVETRPAAEDALGRERVETMQRPAAGEPFDKLFADVVSHDDRVAQEALRQLQSTPVRDELRRDVARLLVALLEDRDGAVRTLARGALVAWASEETVPALLARLQQQDRPGRDEVLAGLAALRDPRSVQPIAAQLPDPSARGAAVRALIALGTPLVEPAVGGYLTSPDEGLQEAACQVLKAVGTESSLAALRRALDTAGHERVARAAYEAIAQIYLRTGKSLPDDIVAPRALTMRPRPLPAEPRPPRNLPPLLRIFEDEADFPSQLSQGGGKGLLESQVKYSGTAALKVIPPQIFHPRLDELNVVICERPGPDAYRYLRFAWKKPSGQKPIGLQLACNGDWQLRYHAGPGNNPWGESRLVAPDLPSDWQVVTCDLYADGGEFVLTGIALDAFDGDLVLFDHLYLARSLQDLPTAEAVSAMATPAPRSARAAPAPALPATASVRAPPSKPQDAPSLLKVFEDEAEFSTRLASGFGGGQVALLAADKYSGTASLKVMPVQVINPRLPGLVARIRENPQPGEYRYLRFAWKKPGGKLPIGLQLASDGQWGFRLHAGPGRIRWGPSLGVAAELPQEWTVVTRDLYADFGEFTLTGMALDAFDGEYALFDHIHLARTLKDLDDRPRQD